MICTICRISLTIFAIAVSASSFTDDLSFEDGENQYKHLKSVLEGSLELPPENVRIYA